MVRAKILIVEDENIVALNIQKRLTELGYTVTATVSSGETAIQLAAQNPPDLVLMDIKLKGSIDGIEAAARMRSRFQIPIVYLTAYADNETLNRAKLTEPYGYISKPFESRDLCTTIEVALYNHQMERQRREREQWLATTLTSMGDAVITTDSQGLVTFMNPMAEMLTCWKQEEVLGNNLTQVFQTINAHTRKVVENPVALALEKGVTVELENHTLLITKNGTEIPIDDSASPIKNENGKVLGAVLVFHDITERQQAEANLQGINQELEVKVSESITQLQQANKQLRLEITQRQRLERELRLALEKERELNELKSRIVATVSHEYRTPLTTILSSTEILEGYSSRLTEERKQLHFQRIKAAVKRMTELVNDVMLINQTIAGELEFHPHLLDIEQFAHKLVADFQRQAAGRREIIFEMQGTPIELLLDWKLLELILSNLLSNAIKYSPEGSRVALQLVVEPTSVVFRVSDKGIGIPSAEQAQLFSAFFRASNVGLIPGVGLGLAIAKECVDLHGGKIDVKSEVGVGTTFTLTLPIISPSALAED
ncbi:MAG TPA: ATP-binding protein [Coleofasciculaceae cyanobacterium]